MVAVAVAAGLTGMGGLFPSAASAGSDWRYCMASWEPGRAVYVTAPFESSGTLAELESGYAAYLDSLGVKHEPPICPRADDEARAIKARENALAFNRSRGLSVSVASWRYPD